ncbi:MAG: hypothetical protein M3Q10_14155 [Chloroflexota bacterium]|nr:hypothetical protein [Chloroflexota bacterium]
MAEAERDGAPEIDQDLGFQRREWALQRLGWLAMGAAILAALLGLTGRGPLSRATAGADGGALRLEYQRFERLQAPTTLRVLLGAGATGDGQAEVWLAREYLEAVEIEQIEPEPQESRAGTDRTTYVVAVDQAAEPVAVTFHLRHETFGRRSGRIGLPDGTAVDFTQVVYP